MTKTLWYTRCPVPTAAGIAIEQGMLAAAFREDGIAVRSLRASTHRNVRESHFDHTQEGSFRQGGSTPPLWSRSRRAATRLIGLTWIDEYQAIVARPESGIASAKDLRGRRAGIPRRLNDQIDFFRAMCLRGFDSALRLAGLTLANMELVELPVAETYMGDVTQSESGQLWSGGHRARREQAEAHALIRGEVDAIYVSGAAGLWLREFLGARDVVDLGWHPDPLVRGSNQQPATLTVSARLAEEHPELVDRYMAVLLKTAKWAECNRRTAVQVFANEVGTSFEWADAAYGADSHLKLAPRLGNDMLGGLEAQKRFLFEHGFIQEDFSIESWLDRGPLERLGVIS